MEHPNATLYRRAMEATMSGDPSAAEILAPNVVWWQIGSPEPLLGREAVLDSMGLLDQVSYEIDVHDVLANDEHVVGLVTATVTAGDRRITYRTAEIMHVVDGHFTERWAFSDDTQAIIEFFSSL